MSLKGRGRTPFGQSFRWYWGERALFGRLAAPCLAVMLSGCVGNAFYHPDSVRYDTPASAGLAFEEVTLTSRDGTALSAWFVPAVELMRPAKAKGTVVHFHGNAQNMSAHWAFVAWLPARGFNVFVFDYRGYGASQGKPDPQGVFEDSDSALNYVRSRPDVDPERLLVFGQSLGGTNAIAVVGAGNRAGVKAVAIEATFHSYSSIANDKFPGAGMFVDDRYSAEKFIGRLTPIPLLMLHGTADSVIPYAHSRRLMEKAGEPKKQLTVEGGEHIEAFSPRFGAKYREALLDFFDASLGFTALPAKPCTHAPPALP